MGVKKALTATSAEEREALVTTTDRPARSTGYERANSSGRAAAETVLSYFKCLVDYLLTCYCPKPGGKGFVTGE